MYGQISGFTQPEAAADEPFVVVVFVLLFLILLVCWIAEEF